MWRDSRGCVQGSYESPESMNKRLLTERFELWVNIIKFTDRVKHLETELDAVCWTLITLDAAEIWEM